MLTFTVVTIFPQMFASILDHSILKRAQEKKLLKINLVDLRDYTTDKHKTTDDSPYGGGQGMVMKPEPLVAAIEEARARNPKARVILLAPQGRVFKQSVAQRLAGEDEIVLLCGRYEGIDERVKGFIDEEISVGDYILSGGEPAANIVIDTVTRLVPGVLGNVDSAEEESFSDGLLEYTQYTRPEDFRGLKVPDVLLSGDHQRVKQWRREKSLELTRERRPDLIAAAQIARPARTIQGRLQARVYLALLHHPVYDKNHQVVTTAVTNMDIHDICRAGKTYGVQGFYLVTPVKSLQKLALKIIDHWELGYGSRYNVTRKDALALARIRDNLDDTILDIDREAGQKPLIVVTSARDTGTPRTPFVTLQEMLQTSTQPFLVVFGTGWGLTETIITQADYVLEAVKGGTGYNHLSVRCAAAIVLDRLLGE
jgi:tRNA (guanine37-N1)-methyltransferase